MSFPPAVEVLERELRGVFGARLQSLVMYGSRASSHATATRTMALVESLTEQDLRGCASRLEAWHAAGLATPLIVPAREFDRSLDVFPLEFSAIMADHVVVAGAAPFERAAVERADLRRACEIQARGHLLHLREGFIEAAQNGNALAVLVAESAASLNALLSSLVYLEGGSARDTGATARHAERLLEYPAGRSLTSRGSPRSTNSRQPTPSVSFLRTSRRWSAWSNTLTDGLGRNEDQRLWPRAEDRVKKHRTGVARAWLRLLAVVLTVATGGSRALAVQNPDLPQLTQPVNDFAHIIDAESAAQLDRLIRALKAASGDVVVVATVPTFEPYGDINEYAVKLFENHGRGIGDKGKDNGLLIVLALKERRVRVEVGYDLEQWITDGYAGETSREFMAPRFRQGEYGAGLLAGTERIVARIAQARGVSIEGVRPPREPRPQNGDGLPFWVIILIIIAFILLSRSGRGGPRSRYWGGGPWSGWSSGVGPFGGGWSSGGGGFGGGFGGFGGGRSGGGGGGASW